MRRAERKIAETKATELANQGEYSEAAKIWDNIGKSFPRAYVSACIAWGFAGDLKRGEQSWDNARDAGLWRAGQAFPDVLRGCELHTAEAQYWESRVATAKQRNSTDPMASLLAAMARSRAGEPDLAEAHMRSAIIDEPNVAGALYADFLDTQGRTKEAARWRNGATARMSGTPVSRSTDPTTQASPPPTAAGRIHRFFTRGPARATGPDSLS